MWLVVGLGNPGKQYADTRHNIGCMVIDLLAETFPTAPPRTSQYAYLRQAVIRNQTVLLIQPQTYMNRSGLSVEEVLHHYEESSEHLIVIYDDLDLELGRLRIRTRGGHGGHKGVKSIIERLESREFLRLRLGIGRPHAERSGDAPYAQGDVVEYVLQPFRHSERTIIDEAMKRAVDAIELIVNNHAQKAMNLYNRHIVQEFSSEL